MRINIKALKKAGIEVDTRDDGNIIEIHPRQFFSLDADRLKNQMREMGLTPGDISSTLEELQNRIHRISMMNIIEETSHLDDHNEE